jgi:hypothetical protein
MSDPHKASDILRALAGTFGEMGRADGPVEISAEFASIIAESLHEVAGAVATLERGAVYALLTPDARAAADQLAADIFRAFGEGYGCDTQADDQTSDLVAFARRGGPQAQIVLFTPRRRQTGPAPSGGDAA